MIGQSGIGLKRGAQGQMRREGMVDVSDPASHSEIRHLLCRTDTTNATAIDLNETDTAVFDEVVRHGDVMSPLASGNFHPRAQSRQLPVRLQSAGMKRLFKPYRTSGFQRRQPGLRSGDVLTPDLTDIHKQNTVLPEALPGSLQVIRVVFDASA